MRKIAALAATAAIIMAGLAGCSGGSTTPAPPVEKGNSILGNEPNVKGPIRFGSFTFKFAKPSDWHQYPGTDEMHLHRIGPNMSFAEITLFGSGSGSGFKSEHKIHLEFKPDASAKTLGRRLLEQVQQQVGRPATFITSLPIKDSKGKTTAQPLSQLTAPGDRVTVLRTPARGGQAECLWAMLVRDADGNNRVQTPGDLLVIVTCNVDGDKKETYSQNPLLEGVLKAAKAGA